MLTTAVTSRLARRLLKIFLALVALPVIMTVLLLERVGRDQILSSTQKMRSIHASSLDTASDQFQLLGRDAAHRSTEQSAGISNRAIGSMVAKMQQSQSAALRTTARDLAELTRNSLSEAVEKSVETNHAAVARVTRETSSLLERSASDMKAHSVGQLESAMLDMIGHRLEERAARIASAATEHVRNHLNYLSLTAQMPDMSRNADGKPEAQKAVLDALVRRFPMFTTVALIDASGDEKALSSSDRVVTEADLRNRSQEPYFREAFAGVPYIHLLAEAAGSNTALRLAVPVELYRGKPVGVLAARLSLDDLFDMIRTTRIGVKGSVSVVDATGKSLVKASQEPGELVSREAEVEMLGWKIVVVLPRAEAVEPITGLKAAIAANTQSTVRKMRVQMNEAARSAARTLNERTASIRTEAGERVHRHVDAVFGKLRQEAASQSRSELANMRQAILTEAQKTQRQIDSRMVGAARTARIGMASRVDPLESEALRTANRRLTIWSILFLIVFATVGGMVALVVAGRIVRPVVHLADGTRAIAGGDLDRRIDETGPDEIGDLAAAFNSMAESLQKSHAELNSAEAQLVQSAKLASLGTLSAGVAHELNQPVAIVRGLAQQLSEESDVPDYAKDDLRLIEKQTGRMVKIIKHLRTFCRMGMNEHTEVDINQVVQDCFILIGAQLKSHNITVDLDLTSDDTVVLADGNEIEQVLLNLITNARDALEEQREEQRDDQREEQQDPAIQIRTRVDGEHVVIVFRDNGKGIPAHVVDRIFDPFFTTKEPGKGTGLGLSISHSIIAKHHGTIAVENAQGAVFTITLPLYKEAFVKESGNMDQAA